MPNLTIAVTAETNDPIEEVWTLWNNPADILKEG
ncbi:hypothetical protein SAMN05216490_1455 [Mucilaginibacter mallensis]|uniref:SRPBCC domain-containing protein n=1 Tax=Mucilaginibacter mallensis TaxID=652787 RepID=A0A1H1TKD2_MUCMA|nr:hypothetical protein SAMN05216490_1455 [Mucilaginibacter mallensis]